MLLENSAYLRQKNSSNTIKRMIDDTSNNFEVVIVCLGENLLRKTVTDNQVHFANPNDSHIRHFVSGVNKLWVDGLALSRKASDIYDKNRFQLIHAHGLAAWIAGMFLKWSYKTPLLLSDDNFRRDGKKNVSEEEEAGEMDQIRKLCLSYANYLLVEVNSGKSKLGYLGKYIVSADKLKNFDQSAYNLIAPGKETKIH